MCIRKSSPSHDSISSQASAWHGSVDSLSVAFDSSMGLQPPWRTYPTVKRSCPDPQSQQLYKASNKFLPRRMRTGGKPRPGNVWLPPHYHNCINATLACEQPSVRLRFSDIGVVILGVFSFSSTPGAVEEPSMLISEPCNRIHGG